MTENTSEIARIVEDAVRAALASERNATLLSRISDVVDISITQIILIVLSLATLLGVLDYVGWLPAKVRRFLRLNRARDTMETLEEFGVDTRNYRDANLTLRFPKGEDSQNIIKVTKRAMEQYLINEKCAVGHTNKTELKRYYDIIGAVCSYTKAEHFASLMGKYWTNYSKSHDDRPDLGFDFVVTPKGGSPTLGYEFAKLMGVPFVLHEERARIHNRPDDVRTYFDMETILPKDRRALIVDDSITGGRMMNGTIKDLRKYGYSVSAAFVIFEVCAKDGRGLLNGNKVNLISMVKVKTNSIEASDNQIEEILRHSAECDTAESQTGKTVAQADPEGND